MRKFTSILMLVVLLVSLSGCAANTGGTPTTQPVSAIQSAEQALTIADTLAMDAVALGALPAADGPLITAAYNSAENVLSQYGAGQITEAQALVDLNNFIVEILTYQKNAQKAQLKLKAKVQDQQHVMSDECTDARRAFADVQYGRRPQ